MPFKKISAVLESIRPSTRACTLEPDKKSIGILWKRNFETDLNSVQEAEHSMGTKVTSELSHRFQARTAQEPGQHLYRSLEGNPAVVTRSETPPGKHPKARQRRERNHPQKRTAQQKEET